MIVIAKFGKPFGVKGLINIHSFFSNKSDIFNHKHFFLENNEKVDLTIKKNNNKIIGCIQSVDSLEGVKKYTNKLIYIEKAKLPRLRGNHYYYNDLENMDVYIDKRIIGKVKKVNNHGAGDYLEIQAFSKEILVPVNKHHVLEVNLIKKKINLNPEYYEF